jgi:hypothetical protein
VAARSGKADGGRTQPGSRLQSVFPKLNSPEKGDLVNVEPAQSCRLNLSATQTDTRWGL